MMTKIEMVKMGMEFHANYYKKYMIRTEKQYIYRREVKTRLEFHLSEEGKKISDLLDTPIFTCPDCGRLIGFNDLECWLGESEEDFLNDEVSCSLCYEDAMGEDL